MNYFDPIREAMEKKGVTAYKLGKELNIGQTTLSGWKDGKKIPLEKAIEILHYLGVSADELYDLKGDTITPDERDLIETYRKCSRTGKSAVQEMAAFQAARSNLSNCPADEEQRAN